MSMQTCRDGLMWAAAVALVIDW